MSAGFRRLREEHRAQVLGHLRARGPLSRTALARDLGLSTPTVSQIVADLESEGVASPVGEGESSGGRRPVLYGVRTEGLRAAGVHVERGRISAVVSDLSGHVHAEETRRGDLRSGQGPFTAALEGLLDRLLAGPAGRGLAGIGVGVPTTMHRSQRGIFRPVGTSGWSGVDLPDLLGRRYGLPVVAENRAHAVAVGEHLFGAGQGATDLLCLVLDQGLGGAVIAGGRLFSGGDGGAGALGRMHIGLPSAAGRPRKVADLVDAAAIVAAARKRLRARGDRSLAGVPLARIDTDAVIDAALAGDRGMVGVLAAVGRCLGAVAAAALCVTDSQHVLLCGSTLRAGALITDPLVEAASARWPFAVPEVRVGTLGIRAAALGAAALVLTGRVNTTVPANSINMVNIANIRRVDANAAAAT